MAYADYTYYTTSWLGNLITATDFPRLALRASDFLDYYTRGKAASATDETVVDALAKACCAVAEQMQEDERLKALAAKSVNAGLAGDGEVKSETVGSWSRSYATAADYASAGAGAVTPRARYARLADEYLVNTGLLYRGGCCG